MCCRPLWLQLHELPPLDYQDPSLLECDPDLVLQEGPDALPYACMKPFLEKWQNLLDVWNAGWRDMLQVRVGIYVRRSSAWPGGMRRTQLLFADGF